MIIQNGRMENPTEPQDNPVEEVKIKRKGRPPMVRAPEEVSLSPEGVRIRKKGRPPTYKDPEEQKKYLSDYFRNYYREKVQGDYKCEHCGQIMANPSNFRRHQRTSKTCEKTRNLNNALEVANSL